MLTVFGGNRKNWPSLYEHHDQYCRRLQRPRQQSLVRPVPFCDEFRVADICCLLVRQLLDLFSTIPNTTDIQISVAKSCIEWAVSERRGFLRQNLETRLVSLYMTKQSYYDALSLINSLLKELKRLDDKLVL